MAKLKISEGSSHCMDDSNGEKSIGARIMRARTHSFKGNDSVKKKRTTNNKSIEQMDNKSIRKLYMNKSIGRLKNTPLETIFEHVDEESVDAPNDSFADDSTIFSKRKMKRSIKFPDMNSKPTKSLKEKRKQRIQKTFGKLKRFKRISMDSFLKHLNAEDLVNITTFQ